MTLTIVLPWPERRLWPNKQPNDRRALHRVRKQAGQGVRLLINNALQLSDYRPPTEGVISGTITFCPPARTHSFDEDNATAAMKAQLDQLAAALEVDDARFHLVPAKGERGGRGQVVIRLE